MDQVFVNVMRAGQVESCHRGTAVLVGPSGDIIQAWGDPERLVFPRSSMKPLQAAILLESGVRMTSQQIALATASHDGEPVHINLVSDWLGQLSLSEGDLACGPAVPFNKPNRLRMVRDGEGPRRIVHTCSGKHCGHMAVCRHEGWDVEGYETSDHPIQKRALLGLQDMTDSALDVVGIDGCSMIAPRMRISDFAKGLAHLSKRMRDGERYATKLAQAVFEHPDLTGGVEAMSSKLTKASKGQAFAKMGAEGMFSVLFPTQGAALALKISDGTERGSEIAIAGLMVEAFRHFGLEASALAPFVTRGLKTAAGAPAGEMRYASL